MKQEIIKESPLSSTQVKHMLEKNKEKLGELNFRAQKTLDHLSSIPTLDEKKAKVLEDAIMKKEIARMREQYVKKLIDTMPTNDKDAKVVLSGFNVTFTNDDIAAIVSMIKDN